MRLRWPLDGQPSSRDRVRRNTPGVAPLPPLPRSATCFLYVGSYFDFSALREIRPFEQVIVFADPLYHYRRVIAHKTTYTGQAHDKLFETDPGTPLDSAALAEIVEEGILPNLMDAAKAHAAASGFEGFELDREAGRAWHVAPAGPKAAAPYVTVQFSTRGVARRLLFVVGTLDDVDVGALLERETGHPRAVSTLAASGASTATFLSAAERLWCKEQVRVFDWRFFLHPIFLFVCFAIAASNVGDDCSALCSVRTCTRPRWTRTPPACASSSPRPRPCPCSSASSRTARSARIFSSGATSAAGGGTRWRRTNT